MIGLCFCCIVYDWLVCVVRNWSLYRYVLLCLIGRRILVYYVQRRISVSRWTQLSHFLPAVYCCRYHRIPWLSSRYGNHSISDMLYCVYMYMLPSLNQGCAWGLFGRDRGETDTLKPETEAETNALTIQAEAKPRPRPSELRRGRGIPAPRPSRGTTAPQDGLETEASRPRPHPTSTSFRGLM